MPKVTRSVSDHLPAGDAGMLAFRRLAQSIEAANALRHDRWGLSLLKDQIRLNLGKIEVMTVTPNTVKLLVDFDALPEDFTKCPGRNLIVRNLDNPEEGVYRSVPYSMFCNIRLAHCPDVADCLNTMEQAHLALLRKAALTPRNPMTAKSHSVAAIQEIEQLLGIKLPQPSYAS